MQMIKNDFLELLVDFLLFSQNYVSLSLDGLGLEFGILQDIGEYVDRSRDIGVEGLGVVDGVFTLYRKISTVPIQGER